VDARGVLWIPAYSANLLVRFDPAAGKFQEIPLPVKDAVPYVTRVDPRDGAIWIGTSAADALIRYQPRSGKFETFPLPSRGALVRHLAVDPKSGAVWLAYGASPGIPARVGRVVVK
jgi:virginiamycin B lyase